MAGAATTEHLRTAAFQYALVDLSPKVLSVLSDMGPGSFFKSFGTGKGAPAEISVGVGDSVQVTVFESSAGGLFIPTDAGARAGNFVQMPAQTVDQTGLISVPYAGEIDVRGRSIISVQKEIEEKLSVRALEPRAIVSIVSQTSSQITVIGQVSAASKININPAGDRVLDVLSKAGGISNAGYETFVTLQRNRKDAKVYFMTLLSNPRENVFVQPGDILYVSQDKRSFAALGASGQMNQFFFEQEQMMLTDAIGKSGGLIDIQADPAQVFVYRLEPRDRLQHMDVNLSPFSKEQKIIPTVYRVNLRDPSGFFAARAFYMQDRDILYVTNADKVELFKFLDLVSAVPGAVASVSTSAATAYTNLKTLRGH